MNKGKYEYDPDLPYVVEHTGQMVARFSDSVTASRFVEGQRRGAYKVVDTRPSRIPEDAQNLMWMTGPGCWEAAVRESEKTWWHRGEQYAEWEIELLIENRNTYVMTVAEVLE